MMLTSGSAWRLGSFFGTPIYVQPGYLLLLALFAYQGTASVPGAPWKGAFLVAFAVTASLLIHEFGHVLAARVNGHRSQVVLVMMGGVTIPSGESRGWRSIFLSVAGPLAGLLTWAILVFVFPVAPQDHSLWPILWNYLVYINLIWSIFNLLPIYPMDGGQALFSFLKLFRRAHESVRISAIISLVIAGLVAWLMINRDMTFGFIILALLAYQNWERLQEKA